MNIKARIIEINETQQITESFKKRDFIVEYAENPEYPEFIKFELLQDKTDLVNDITKGSEVDVSFNLRGRKWQDPKDKTIKYFNSLQAWKIDVLQAAQQEDDKDDLLF